jgi:hypothetical protein
MHETVSTLTKMSNSLETGLFDSNPNEKVKICIVLFNNSELILD